VTVRRRLASLSESNIAFLWISGDNDVRMGISTSPASVEIQRSREALKSVITRSRGGRADVRISAYISFMATDCFYRVYGIGHHEARLTSTLNGTTALVY
jgi:hypothetical protein